MTAGGLTSTPELRRRRDQAADKAERRVAPAQAQELLGMPGYVECGPPRFMKVTENRPRCGHG